MLRLFFTPELREIPESTILLDRSGLNIGELLSSDGKRHIAGMNKEDAKIPTLMQRSLIALEDRRFASHIGVDPIAVGRALYTRAVDGQSQWASTLTMGLARNLLGVERTRSYSAKFSEILLALRLELSYSKSQILTQYLERIEFGRLSIGVSAAARSYFGVSLESLRPAEQIALITMLKNPAKYDLAREPEAFRVRYALIIRELVSTGIILESEAEIFLADPLTLTDTRSELPYIRDMVRSANGRYGLGDTRSSSLTLSIDSKLTAQVSRIARQVQSELARKNVGDYGVLVVDRATGQVRVIIGGSAYYADNGQVNAVLARRQVGSTIKPFTYLLAVNENGRSMTDTITDLPVSFATAEGTSYEPKNYSLKYRWAITLAEALAGSVNVPAVKIAQEVGVPRLLQFLRSLGVSSLTEWPEHYGLALTLGVGEISLWELVEAYSIFGNNGSICPLTLADAGGDLCPKLPTIAGKEAIDQIVETLSNPLYRQAEFAVGSALDFGETRVFVKTGTSRNFRDNYAIGMTDNYWIGVWTGNKDGSNMQGVSGASGAGEIFAQIVRAIDPAGLSSRTPLPEVNWDVKSSDSAQIQRATLNTLEITRPLAGTRYQSRGELGITYWSDLEYDRVEYELDGQRLPSNRIILSKISLGDHAVKVRLYNTRGEMLGEEQVQFEVEKN
jgi:penicillin-binding protein 1C